MAGGRGDAEGERRALCGRHPRWGCRPQDRLRPPQGRTLSLSISLSRERALSLSLSLYHSEFNVIKPQGTSRFIILDDWLAPQGATHSHPCRSLWFFVHRRRTLETILHPRFVSLSRFIILDTGPRRPLRLELSDTNAMGLKHEPTRVNWRRCRGSNQPLRPIQRVVSKSRATFIPKSRATFIRTQACVRSASSLTTSSLNPPSPPSLLFSSLELSDTQVYEPLIRALLGTDSHFMSLSLSHTHSLSLTLAHTHTHTLSGLGLVG